MPAPPDRRRRSRGGGARHRAARRRRRGASAATATRRARPRAAPPARRTGPHRHGRELAVALRDVVGLGDWGSYYAPDDDWAAPFVDGFASGDLIAPGGPWKGKAVLLGVALYAPGLCYPPHGHAAPEAYLIARGHARSVIDGVVRDVGPGDVVIHPKDASHTYDVTDDAPLWLAWVRAGDVDAPVWASLPDGRVHHPRSAP